MNMIMLHVAIALMSLGVSLVNVAVPSRRLLQLSYGLIAGTVVSGTALVVIDSARLLHVCASGLVYVAAATAMTYIAARRMRQLAK